MNSKTLSAAAAVLAAAFIFACAPSGRPGGESPGSGRLTVTVAFATGIGGTWHSIAEGVAEILRTSVPGARTSAIPGSSDGNLARLSRDEIELAVSTTDSANTALRGWESFKEPLGPEDVKAIACLYFARIQFIVMDRLGVTSIEEIREKEVPLRISVGTRGSGMEIGARRVLGAYGITYEDIEKWGGRIFYFGSKESCRMMGDGQLNAYFGLGAIPMSPALSELELKRDFTVLPISRDVIDRLVREFNYVPAVIPEGSYRGVKEDIPTISIANGLYAANGMDEETAYLITRTLLENIDRLRMIHSQLKDLTPEFMNRDMVFPMHPGALKAYAEAAGSN